MDKLFEFLLVFIFSYLFYLFFIIMKKKNKKFRKSVIRTEEHYLISKYKIDFNKVNYRKFLCIIYLVNSFIIATTFTLIGFVKGIFFELLLSVVIFFPLIIISYNIIGKYLVKKGCVRDV